MVCPQVLQNSYWVVVKQKLIISKRWKEEKKESVEYYRSVSQIVGLVVWPVTHVQHCVMPSWSGEAPSFSYTHTRTRVRVCVKSTFMSGLWVFFCSPGKIKAMTKAQQSFIKCNFFSFRMKSLFQHFCCIMFAQNPLRNSFTLGFLCLFGFLKASQFRDQP